MPTNTDQTQLEGTVHHLVTYKQKKAQTYMSLRLFLYSNVITVLAECRCERRVLCQSCRGRSRCYPPCGDG